MASKVSYADILSAPQLCGMIQETTTGIPDVFPKGYYGVEKTVAKDFGTYFAKTGTRTVAKLNAYGAPSQSATLRDRREVPVKLISTSEHINLDMSKFMALFSPTNSEGANIAVDPQGLEDIALQIGDFRQKFDNLRIAALTQMLFNGSLYWNDKGSLLPSSAGATNTASMQVPAGNQGQLNVNGTGNIINTGWNNFGTAIDKQILNLRQAAIQLTGYPLMHAFYGANVPNYLINNNTLQGFFVRNQNEAGLQSANGQYLRTADIPSPLLGMQWHPAWEAFFEDDNGTNQPIVGADQVLFTPEPSKAWIAWLNGSTPVPGDNFYVTNDANAGPTKVMTASGMYAYATQTTDPVGIKLVAGDVFLPVLKVPGAIFQATVAFGS